MNQEIINITKLQGEHYEEYKKFTRLLLALSVGFITFITATHNNEIGAFSFYQKLGISLHCMSILFGVWLQYIILYSSLEDINTYINRLKNKTEKEKREGMFVNINPSRKERAVFLLQIILFVFAFFIISVNVIYNA